MRFLVQCNIDGIPRASRTPAATTPAGGSGPLLSEVFSDLATDAGAAGFVLARLPRGLGPILWVQDRFSQLESGRPYLPGLGGRRLIHVGVSRPVDVLWAMEEGLRCPSLGAVIGELWGDPAVMSFTATRRLAIRAERHGVACWLIRRAASAGASAARDRWRIASLPSAPHPDDLRAPGDPRWHAQLFRSRSRAPGDWVVSHDRTADHLHFAAADGDRALAGGDDAGRDRAAG